MTRSTLDAPTPVIAPVRRCAWAHCDEPAKPDSRFCVAHTLALVQEDRRRQGVCVACGRDRISDWSKRDLCDGCELMREERSRDFEDHDPEDYC